MSARTFYASASADEVRDADLSLVARLAYALFKPNPFGKLPLESGEDDEDEWVAPRRARVWPVPGRIYGRERP